MAACGLLSGARTAAIEGRKSGVPVNVLAVEDDTTARDSRGVGGTAAEPGGPSGELVHLGSAHLGKALA